MAHQPRRATTRTTISALRYSVLRFFSRQASAKLPFACQRRLRLSIFCDATPASVSWRGRFGSCLRRRHPTAPSTPPLRDGDRTLDAIVNVRARTSSVLGEPERQVSITFAASLRSTVQVFSTPHGIVYGTTVLDGAHVVGCDLRKTSMRRRRDGSMSSSLTAAATIAHTPSWRPARDREFLSGSRTHDRHDNTHEARRYDSSKTILVSSCLRGPTRVIEALSRRCANEPRDLPSRPKRGGDLSSAPRTRRTSAARPVTARGSA